MAYATLTDLYTYGLPSTALPASITTPMREANLEAASILVDTYLKSYYTVPLLIVTADVTRAVCIIAAYDLLTVRGFSPEQFDGALEKRYGQTFDWLSRIANGSCSLVGIVDGSPNHSKGGPQVASKPARGSWT